MTDMTKYTPPIYDEHYAATKKSDEECLAMEAVMMSVDPATWSGLTIAQRCALGRFAKPQPAEQQPEVVVTGDEECNDSYPLNTLENFLDEQDIRGQIEKQLVAKAWYRAIESVSPQPLPDDKPEVAVIETDNFICKYAGSEYVKNAVFERVLEFFKTHEVFNGECIMQSDSPLIDAPNVLADIADEIIKFNVQCK